jgi:uncharacterized membrane protein
MSLSVTLFGLALLTLLLLVSYVGSYRPGLGMESWLLIVAGAAHLVRGARRRAPLAGMRYAVLCAAIPFAIVTQAVATTTLFFGGAALLILLLEVLISLLPKRCWRP